MEIIDEATLAEAGRELGHDYHRLTRLPLQADWPVCVKEGFVAAAATHRGGRRSADRFERKWLQLRLGAWLRRRSVADDVTVELLQRLDLSHCPITREPLTHGALADTDGSIDRLNNDGAYTASNLAVMSVRANRAKAALSFEQVLARAESAQTQDLTPAQWLRLAVLMLGPAFATRHAMAPILPLCAPLPAHSLRLALQQIQRLFTLQAERPAGKNALVRDLRPACHSEASLLRLRRLADAVHEGLKQIGCDEPCWDVWLQPAVMAALTQWRTQLDEREWAEVACLSGQLAGGRRVTPRSLQSWQLPTGGYLPGFMPNRRSPASSRDIRA